MDWNGNLRPPFVPRSDNNNNSLNFFYNHNYDPYSVMEMKHQMHAQNAMFSGMEMKSNYGNQEKKKRLSTDQLESLENCFQEEIKLEPDRKMKLAKELGLQPRQIAVWFQNRRARWKNKQLERLYGALKQEFDVVSKEKHKLQEEVVALRTILKEQVGKNPVVSTEMSGEETVESTSIRSSNMKGRGPNNQQMGGECSYVFNHVVDDYNNVMPSSYWAALPTNYP